MIRRITTSRAPARIEYLKVRNFRALRDVEFKDLMPLTVLLGPNGSGKSTVFDVFAFLAECFEFGLRRAWDKRGRAKELKTRGGDGPVTIEIKYREHGYPLITYHLAVDERAGAPVVVEEWLRWKRSSHGQPFRFLDYREGLGSAVSGELPDEEDQRVDTPLNSADLLAVNALGQFAEHPRVAALRDFITGWYVSYLSADSARGQPEAGPQDRLSRSGDNIANVIQFLAEQHPQRLEQIFSVLRQRVPRIESVLSETMPDGRLLLQIKDAPFSHPVLARFASDGTLKMLAYLVMLNDPSPPPSSASRSRRTSSIHACCLNSPRSAALLSPRHSSWLPPIPPSSSTACGQRRYVFCGAMHRVTPRPSEPATSRASRRSWRKAPCWASYGWRASSGWATPW